MAGTYPFGRGEEDEPGPFLFHCRLTEAQHGRTMFDADVEPTRSVARAARGTVMIRRFARCALGLGGIGVSAAAMAGPSVCLDTISELELVHRVKQDAYFTHNAPLGKRLRIEYDRDSARDLCRVCDCGSISWTSTARKILR